jgi:hypothetical protein
LLRVYEARWVCQSKSTKEKENKGKKNPRVLPPLSRFEIPTQLWDLDRQLANSWTLHRLTGARVLSGNSTTSIGRQLTSWALVVAIIIVGNP